MRLILNDTTGSIKDNYLQSLVLLYLPCETFSPTENDDKALHVSVEAHEGVLTAALQIKVYERTAALSRTQQISAESAEPLRLQVKLLVGGAFLEAAQELFGYLPPWGIVTGHSSG